MCFYNDPSSTGECRSFILKNLIPVIGFRFFKTALVLLCLSMTQLTGLAQVPPSSAKAQLTSRFRADRILVRPKADTNLAALANFHAAQKAQVTRTFEGIDNLQIVRLPKGETVPGFIRRYEQSGLVEYAEPDYIVHVAATTPNDPYYTNGTLWGLNNTGQNGGTVDADIDAPEGWDVLTSASNIVVAVLDTGVRYTHEDLAENMWVNPNDGGHGLNVVTNGNDSNNPEDDHGHGTMVAGILGAVGNNGKGVVGVAWRVQIMACKFVDNFGYGSTSDAITCLEYARTNGAKIINASWGDYDYSLSLSNAIYSARNAGIIFVAAAGNDLRNTDIIPFYPASYDLDNIVSVAATTRTDDLVSYSNFGVTNVDLAAPGTNIYSTDFLSDSAYSTDEGTSMAAPHVTGTLALMLAKYATETHQQIINRLLSATDPLPALSGKCVTGGRLNFQKAIGPPIRLTAIPPVNNGPFQLHLSGDPNRTYIIQVATNLTYWSPVFTNITGTNGTFDFTDNQSTNSTQRFYRALSAP